MQTTELSKFKELFQGREDCFAEQQPDGSYYAMKESLTDKVLNEHLSGKRTVGLFLIKEDKVKFLCLDIDKPDESVLKQILFASENIGFNPNQILTEFSGHKGYHVFIFLADWLSAKDARKLAKIILAESGEGLPPIEVFPKQDSTGQNGLGNCIKLPLGIHKKSGKRSYFLNAEFKQADDGISRIELVTKKQVEFILKQYSETEKTQPPRTDISLNKGLPCFKKMLDGVPEGCRDEVAFRLAVHFKKQGLTSDLAVTALSAWNGKNKPPLSSKIIEDKIHSAYSKDYTGFGCDSDIIKRFCDSSCPIHQKNHHKPQEPEAMLGDFIPETGFLRDYMSYTSPLTDAPEIFHLFAGLQVLSIAVNNKVFIQFGAQELYPNLWVILLAPSSFFRKSTALAIANGLIREFNSKLLLPSEFSAEVFVESLAIQPQGLLTWFELGGALEYLNRQYMMGVKELLTELFDCPSEYRRKLKYSDHTIKNPFLSILSATTIDWFAPRVKEGDVKGGFFARFIYVPVNKKTKRIAFPPEDDKTLRKKLLEQLKTISTIKGKADISDIKEAYEQWVFTHEDELEKEDSKARLSGFYTRLSIYVLKIALLYELSVTGALIISLDSFNRAVKTIEWLKSKVKYLLQNEFLATKFMQDKKKVLDYIKTHKGTTRSILLRNLGYKKTELSEIIDTLIEQGSIMTEDKIFRLI